MNAASASIGLSKSRSLAGLAVVLAVATALRWQATQSDGLWMDEIFGASYVNLNPWEVVVAVLRFDIHPPGYYLQLKAWSVLGRSDQWLLLNSVAWSLGSVVAVYLGVSRRADRIAGLLAAACVALLGSEIFFASELRMYAMLSCMALVLWQVVDAWLDKGGKALCLWVLSLLLVLSLLHSVAFLAIGSVLAFAWLTWWQRRPSVVSLRAMVCLTVAAGLLLMPWLANAFVRSVSHTAVPSAQVMAGTVGGWWLGYFPGVTPLQLSVAALVSLVVILALMLSGTRQVRALVLCFVVAPLVLVAAVSMLVRPIWLDRTLAYAAVFLPVALALQWHAWSGGGSRQWGVGLLVLAMQGTVLFGFIHLAEGLQTSRKMQFREAAAYIAEHNPSRLPVYVPSNVRFWAMARYLQGPAWGSLLAIQDPVRADDSDTWRRVYARLGSDLLDRLHLVPSARTVESPSGALWIGPTPLPPDVAAKGFFFVGDMRDRDRTQACPQGTEVARTAFVGVMVFECR
ncbi:MAG: hypothetical protein KF871_09675 [Hydrogenophaga sp.]|uniref:hypothetical protein n=1 Tax=Hydrogenophaga sp. TaxID=1904254 RepID=UPI001DB3A92D|nr:hypothetical protein [Hydrogenophaga sp.]MBX3610154.1 hypothetical protein [Hydrogenophaga sp.]